MMKTSKTLQIGLISLACTLIGTPSFALDGYSVAAVGNPNASPRDVKLQADGHLRGHVVDAAGRELAGEMLGISYNGREIARVATDQDGQFQVRNLRGGVHQIATGRSVASLRLWSPGTAPPSASSDALVVAEPVVRGQHPQCGQPGCQGECGNGVLEEDTVYYDDGAGYGGECRDSGCYGYSQDNHGARHGLWGRPLLIGGIIATAVAVPVALADDDDRRDAD